MERTPEMGLNAGQNSVYTENNLSDYRRREALAE